MKFLTEEDISTIRKQSPYVNNYYKDRWGYLSEIIDEIKKLDGIEKTLEMGPFRSPLVVGGDIIDVTDSNLNFYPFKIGKFIKHDCSQVPYPIEDKAYDLIIASQVLEHLGILGEQKAVFNELKRITKKAIITLPYMWFAPNERDHHMIDERMINYWTDNYKPIFKQITGEGARRILLVYDFEQSD